MVWKVPPSGLVLGSALGCDIRLPSELPPVALMVFPVVGPAGSSARIRPLAPLLEITHNGREWTGESLPVGESLQMGPVTLKLLNAIGHRLDTPTLNPEPLAPVAKEPDTQDNAQTKPKKKISWLRRWQRSLELRESTLLVSKSWGFQQTPPVPDLPTPKPESANPPTQQPPAMVDKNWHDLEEWIQSARNQADACAQERDRLKKMQQEAESLHRDLEISLDELRREKEKYQLIQQEQMLRQEQAARALEEARLALIRQAGILAEERSALPPSIPPIESPNLPSDFPEEPLQSLWDALENSRVDTASLHNPGQIPQPKSDSRLTPHGTQPDSSLESLWRQLSTLDESGNESANEGKDPGELAAAVTTVIPHIGSTIGTPTDQETSPSVILKNGQDPDDSESNKPDLPGEPSQAETLLYGQTPPETGDDNQPDSNLQGTVESIAPSPPEHQQVRDQEPGFELEDRQESEEEENEDEDQDEAEEENSLEDQENFLPQPEPEALAAFQQWCQSRLAAAAEQVRTNPGLDDSISLPGEDNAHRQGFARKLVEQNLTNPNTIRPLSRFSSTQGIPLEDLLVRLGLFTTHQVATMGLGCSSDLVVGRWFILELPAIDGMDLDKELVFRVFDPRDNANRVLRILAPGEAKKPARALEYRERHLACSKLDSEHLLGTVEVSELGGLPCVLQEDSSGVSSENWPPLGASATVWYRLFLQAAVALRDLHEKGMAHGHLEAGDFQLQPEGLLQISGAGTPSWLCQGGPFPTPSPAQDLADLARISHQWWTGRDGENQRYLPEPLAGILARLESGHQNSIISARSLAEELDRAGILLPSGASAWQRFLDELNGPELSQTVITSDEEDPDGEVLRQSA